MSYSIIVVDDPVVVVLIEQRKDVVAKFHISNSGLPVGVQGDHLGWRKIGFDVHASENGQGTAQ